MIRVKYIRKNRDEKRNIRSYLLQDYNGAMRIATSNQVKETIIDKQIVIDNLQLDTLWRLVDEIQQKPQQYFQPLQRFRHQSINKISLGMQYIKNINKVFPDSYHVTKSLLENAYNQKNNISFEKGKNIPFNKRDMPQDAVNYINSIKDKLLEQINKNFVLFYINDHEPVDQMLKRSKIPSCVTEFYKVSNCSNAIYCSLIMIFIKECVHNNNGSSVIIGDNTVLIQGKR